MLSKLHSQTAMDHDRRHLKAAKALVIVIPLFGFTNILTIMGPSDVGLKILQREAKCILPQLYHHLYLTHLKYNAHLSPDRVPARLRHLPVIQGGLPLYHGGGDHAALLLLQLRGPPRRADQVHHSFTFFYCLPLGKMKLRSTVLSHWWPRSRHDID